MNNSYYKTPYKLTAVWQMYFSTYIYSNSMLSQFCIFKFEKRKVFFFKNKALSFFALYDSSRNLSAQYIIFFNSLENQPLVWTLFPHVFFCICMTVGKNNDYIIYIPSQVYYYCLIDNWKLKPYTFPIRSWICSAIRFFEIHLFVL